ncbi:MAG: transcriptional regulator NrdR [Clostridiales bacterium]|nr:transcriptional regulator NrdR [Clostridiales bacterium]
MKCPSCGYLESKVIDSRPTDEGRSIRRRRECLECGARFTTFETLESYPILVIKKNGTREAFDRTKIMNGLIKACQKRPVTMEQLEKVVSDIENELQNSLNHEIQSQKIGEMIMDKLKKIDEVAYVRFASVYREFKDLDTFMRELAALKNENK